MTFKQRLPYFLVGLFIGIIVVIFVWGKKNTSFDYGPNARVLKNLSTKEKVYSSKAVQTLKDNTLDSSYISIILRTGNVDLWNKIKKESSTVYPIQGIDSLSHILIFVENKKTEALVDSIKVN